MGVSVELYTALDGTTTVYLLHKNRGYKKRTTLGHIKGDVFFKPVNVIYRTENSIGVEKAVLDVLKKEGVRWINLLINKTWYPVPIGYWYSDPRLIKVEYKGEVQHHLPLPRIRELANIYRDKYARGGKNGRP